MQETTTSASPGTSRWRLDGRTALVTGGTKKGIGEAIARELASLGCRVHICGRAGIAVAKAVQDLNASTSDSDTKLCSGSRADVTVAEDREALKSLLVDTFGGKLDFLINNGTYARVMHDSDRRLDS